MISDNTKIIIIKMRQDACALDNFRSYLLDSSSSDKEPAYYNITTANSPADNQIFEQMQSDKDYYCALLDYDKDSIVTLYWASCKQYKSNSYKSIHCRLLFKTSDLALIENFVYSLQLDLNKDFKDDSYINFEDSKTLIDQMSKYESRPYIPPTKHVEYKSLEEEDKLSSLAQKNSYCKRKYNLRDSDDQDDRSEFQHDYDRIIYSKAYRRMEDKAQIFSSSKGDHYRTRMTHTIVVCQISRSISNELHLNTDLAEAIAAGHDLGHTPFGHQGERTLHNIITGVPGFEVPNLAVIDPKTEKDAKPVFPYGGFKHNYQSVRVATLLENQYPEINGLDLSYQTLNGMWMHTKQKDDVDISEFSDDFLSQDGDCAVTLEGQVVAVADEIAQRSHDLDDAFAAQLISVKELTDYLSLHQFNDLQDEINNINSSVDDLQKKNRLFADKAEMLHAQVSSLVIKYFIRDVVCQSKEKIDSYDVTKFEKENHEIHEQLIRFSPNGEKLCKYLESIVNKRVINSHEVAKFDENNSNIVLGLFRSYYKNPTLLHEGTLQRIWNDYRQNNLIMVDFKEGKPEIIRRQWEEITTAAIPANAASRNEKQSDLLKKRKILVRKICDFISGMTDSYALSEYNSIVQ